ncbi:hypothetical protein HY641_03185 [Candidatus Woesearchaeota archaeon]|nr:hypothetical protein [Candidatus Woesearchaeota archaeon]
MNYGNNTYRSRQGIAWVPLMIGAAALGATYLAYRGYNSGAEGIKQDGQSVIEGFKSAVGGAGDLIERTMGSDRVSVTLKDGTTVYVPKQTDAERAAKSVEIMAVQTGTATIDIEAKLLEPTASVTTPQILRFEGLQDGNSKISIKYNSVP